MAPLTSEDVPSLPKRLRSDATEEEKAERARMMAERHRVQKALHDQKRHRPNREDMSRYKEDKRDYSGVGNHRGARRLFNEARHRPLPRVMAETHSELVRLTNAYEAAGAARCFGAMGCNTKGGCVHSLAYWQAYAQVKEAWEAVLQRHLPKYGSDFWLDEEGDPCFLRGGQTHHSIVRRAILKRCGSDEHELTYGLCYDGNMHSGEIHSFNTAGEPSLPALPCAPHQPCSHALFQLCRPHHVRDRRLASACPSSPPEHP